LKNKIILLISIPGSFVGGAQKRYINLFNYIRSRRKDYYFVINKKLYLSLITNGILDSENNIRVITLLGEKKIESISCTAETGPGNTTPDVAKKKSGLRLFIGRNKMFVKSILIWISFAKEFRKVLKELNCNLVYSIWTGGVFAWPLKKVFKFKLIYSYNDSTLDMVKRNITGIFNDSELWALKNADKIDFLSPGIVKSYKKMAGNIPDNRVTITPNSFIDYSRYYADSNKENNVVFLSRLWPNKNPLLFLESVKLFNEKYSDLSGIKYFIIGEGGLEKEIINYISKNNLSNVRFEGKTYEPWLYLRKSKVFISIQQVNNYPSQSLIEAMACENAIIASDVGETRLLVTDKEGILVEFNPESISAAIFKLFSTSGLIENMGANARKKVLENHTIEKFADYFYSITDK